jgi:hypothetical protein
MLDSCWPIIFLPSEIYVLITTITTRVVPRALKLAGLSPLHAYILGSWPWLGRDRGGGSRVLVMSALVKVKAFWSVFFLLFLFVMLVVGRLSCKLDVRC